MQNELYMPGFAAKREAPSLLRDEAENAVKLLRQMADLIAAGTRISSKHQIAVRFLTREEVETWAETLFEQDDASDPNQLSREDIEFAIAWLTGERVRLAIEEQMSALQAGSDEEKALLLAKLHRACERVHSADYTPAEGVLSILEAITTARPLARDAAREQP